MAMVLADVPSATGNTFFTDRVANTTLVANADAYYSPGGLITFAGTTNTFPYKQLVDELAGGTGSRNGQSNGGNVAGNFGTDGWTRAEFGPTNDGWTGYGALHQGQTSTNTLSLNKSDLAGGLDLDVAIVAKYGDPRGGTTGAQKKANRLPPATADATLFAYRMPHNALDGSRVIVEPATGNFLPNAISGSDLSFHVEDADARAAETSAADLSADLAFDTVAVGESGTPTLEVCIPGVLGDATFVEDVSTVVDDDSGFGGDAAIDTGIPGDALFYSETVTKAAGTGQTSGSYTGMVRVTDPEVGLLIGLDEALAPLPTAPAPVTYQSFSVTMGTLNTPPTASYATTTASINSGGTVTINVSSVVDAESDPIDVEVDWDNNGTYDAAGTINPPYPVANNFTSPITYTYSGPGVDTRTVPCRISDNVAPDVNLLPSATFTVNSNARCPLPVPAKTAANITTQWPVGATDIAAWLLPADPTGATYPAAFGGNPNNYAAFRGATIAGLPAGWVGQFRGTSTVSPNLFFNFVRLFQGATVTDPTSSIIISDLDTPTTGTLYNRQVSDVEVDSNNRVIFTRRNAGSFSGSGSPLISYSSNSADIFWFDYDGTVLITDAQINTISTSGTILVAICLDSLNNIWGIDVNQILHYYQKTGATTYAEVLTSPFPLDLKLPPINMPANTGVGAANHKISDFVVDPYNGAFFILEESAIAAAPNSLDGRLYRVECDGSFLATIGGNPNPSAPMNITDSTAQGIGSDVVIDNLNASGGQLGAQSDVQIIVLGQNTQATGAPWNDEYIFTSELFLSNGSDFAGASGIKGAVSETSNLFCRSNGTAGSHRLYWTPPTGWQ
jgi:hypothetical protein